MFQVSRQSPSDSRRTYENTTSGKITSTNQNQVTRRPNVAKTDFRPSFLQLKYTIIDR